MPTEEPGEPGISADDVANDLSLVFTSTGRSPVWFAEGDEDFHWEISCAIGQDGRSPAAEFLANLLAGTANEDPRFTRAPDRAQIDDYARLISLMEDIGRYGSPRHGDAVGYLRDGIWEFRHGTRRVSFWDTPGDGTYVPKPVIQDSREVDPARHNEYWWYPDMDRYLRLGPAWHKNSDKAPQHLIEAAIQLREEDCQHDRDVATTSAVQ